MRTLTIEVKSGIGGDGFNAIITDGDVEIYEESYNYGYNASYSDTRADEKPPYVSDILTELVKEYQIDKIIITAGRNVFTGKQVKDSRVMDFKPKYIEGHEELERLC